MNKHLGKLADEINLYVFHSNDCFSFITNKVDTTYHKHYYIQLTIGLEKQFKCQFDDATYNIRGILIGSNVNHKLIGHNEWQLYMLINPESTLGEFIKSKWLLSSEHILLTDDIVNDIVHIIPNKMAGDQYKLFFEKMKKILGKESYQQSNRDERIMRLIQYIDDHSLDELSVKKLSNVVFLSESRLSHLFKEQIGISLTSYILHKKVEKGFHHIFHGKSITESALEAGFSTPSHFTNSVRDKLGMSPRHILKDSSYLQV